MEREAAQETEKIGAGLAVDRMPAHWLMARLGKRVLRPGGVELTRWLIKQVEIDATSTVVELAPGLGSLSCSCGAAMISTRSASSRRD